MTMRAGLLEGDFELRMNGFFVIGEQNMNASGSWSSASELASNSVC